ncbi:hypothetical protein FACS189493_2080 [Spirochaetia bacterium]|nr:hypothetical protein FACS189493_2080 [Spirochaetia bacterium]
MLQLTVARNRLTAHGSRLTAHGSRLTAHGSYDTEKSQKNLLDKATKFTFSGKNALFGGRE